VDLEIAVMMVVALAFTVEATVGFGATMITVALGSQLVALRPLLAAFVPLNVVLSLVLMFRNWQHTDKVLLTRRVLPWMLLGVPFGIALAGRLQETVLKRTFGALVFVLALIETLRALRYSSDTVQETVRPLPARIAAPMLTLAGIVHGMFATGGPLVVYVLGREVTNKTVFRATLSALWLLLNVILVVTYGVRGELTVAVLTHTAMMVPALLVGLWVGGWLHLRVQQRTFHRAVFVLLMGAGAMLFLRG
jgi:uncharacterized protein